MQFSELRKQVRFLYNLIKLKHPITINETLVI